MSLDYWYPFYPAKFKSSTRHLTAEQDGIYRRLIDEYMQTREPLPDNDIALARIAGVNEINWLDAARILRAYFKHKDGMLFHDFCDQMLDFQDKKSKSRKESAENAARKRWKKNEQNQTVKCGSHAEGNANAMRGDATMTMTSTMTEELLSKNPKTPSVEKNKKFRVSGGEVDFDGLFERLWLIYPNIRNRGAKAKAKMEMQKKISKGIDYELIGRGIAKYKAYCDKTQEKNKDMFRWLRDDLYNENYSATGENQQNARFTKNNAASLPRAKSVTADEFAALCNPDLS